MELYACLPAILGLLVLLSPFNFSDNSSFVLLLVVLFRQDVLQQPFKNSGITVNRNIYFITIRYLIETSFKIFHVLNQQTSTEGEIPLLFFGIINDMDHYWVFEIRSLNGLSHGAIQRWIDGGSWTGCVLCCRLRWTWRFVLGWLLILGHFKIGDERFGCHCFSKSTVIIIYLNIKIYNFLI